MKILITCPPMLRSFALFREDFARRGWVPTHPEVRQALTEEALLDIVPLHDGWIIGDDPANAKVFAAGRGGRLRAAVKWGVGVDNVDFAGARDAGVAVTHTPGMFGREVADVAMSYVVSIARQLHVVHRGVVEGGWPKPVGVSLAGKCAALVGFGDIGRQIARRLLVSDMRVLVYDPRYKADAAIQPVETSVWPDRLEEADFIILACALTTENRHLLRQDVLERCRSGVSVVNVSRGGLINESDLAAALATGKVHSAALEVMEAEPLPPDSPLRNYPQCLFGSHNASNTMEAVRRTSETAVRLLAQALDDSP